MSTVENPADKTGAPAPVGPAAPATLHDVAREAGVSLATASRSLNGSTRRVADAYRDRVLAAAAKLDYSPNLSAQAVARGSTMTVGLVVSDIADPYFSSIAAGAMRVAEESGLVVTMAVTGRSPERELEIVRTLRGQRPRIILLAGSRSQGSAVRDALIGELQSFEASGGRVVMISQRDLPFATLSLDNDDGAFELATTMAGFGYRRFAVIAGTANVRTSLDRVDGFRRGLLAAGVDSETVVVETEFTRDGGYDAGRRLLERGLDDIELVFAVTDVMALGAMAAFRESGVEPGRDIAVAGFDDIPTVRDVTPALTTVRAPLVDIGERAVRLALGDDFDRASVDAVPTTVVVRASTPRR
ncbi:LacI family transcriptional regulator [Frondihabitans sucicola]|uniref:LacI family transcriptional regulator n=1 Tax=Frondihabitans sucicola TaxID=1268041 RepID=A0ABM8GP91_9MICO|nr:LacI family DNA-binding transcriptional regulator [Frondihabitans sucicola]BDZ50258.1 LacI family transcriptional regulator [Frondihabitans sucicola]